MWLPERLFWVGLILGVFFVDLALCIIYLFGFFFRSYYLFARRSKIWFSNHLTVTVEAPLKSQDYIAALIRAADIRIGGPAVSNTNMML